MNYASIIPIYAVDSGVGGILARKSAKSRDCGQFQTGNTLRAGILLHLPILGELETVFENRPAGWGVLKKVADRFSQNTPAHRPILGVCGILLQGKFVFCKYPALLACKTRLKDKNWHLRVNLNVRGFKPLVAVCIKSICTLLQTSTGG